ncbi:MAG: RluA family pseudouridine synthase [Deltaproteobacteria bacterium]|nr:RluA family pseudouridine synthase [Deltaproteobacteria bacterium]
MSADLPPFEFVVDAQADGSRLDRFLLAEMPDVTRGSIERLCARGRVRVDGKRAAKGMRLRGGQVVAVAAALDEQPVAQPELALEVLAERADFIAVNKPAGLPCHPLVPGETDTLANALVARFPECATASVVAREGGLTHRLDTSTSGILLAARSRESYSRIRQWFAEGQVGKRYLALVEGAIDDSGVVDYPIEADPNDRRRVVAVRDRFDRGLGATTNYQPIATHGELSLLEVGCTTGRRHQVRVHLAAIGHPLVADTLYGARAVAQLRGAFLHALSLQIADELLTAPLPPNRAQYLRESGFDPSPFVG